MQRFFNIIAIFLLPIYATWGDMLFLKDGTLYESVTIKGASSTSVTVEINKENKVFPQSEVLRLRYVENNIETINILLNNDSLISGYLIDQNSREVVIRRTKNSPAEETYEKKDIKQMSNKSLIIMYPELALSGGILYPVNTGDAHLDIAPMGLLAIQMNPNFLKKFSFAIDAGFAQSGSKNFPRMSLIFAPLLFDVGFKISLNSFKSGKKSSSDNSSKKAGTVEIVEKTESNSWIKERLSFIPKMGVGGVYLRYDDGEGKILQTIDFALMSGIDIQLEVIKRRLFLKLGTNYILFAEKNTQVHSLNSMFNINLRI